MKHNSIDTGRFKAMLAVREGFEPSKPCDLHTFQACSFGHSDTSPHFQIRSSLAALGGLLEIGLPQRGKELPQHHSALFLEYSTTDLNSMVESFVLGDIS